MRKESIKGYPGKKKFFAGAVAVLAVVALVLCIPALQARADFDESTAVRFRTYKSSHTIENSVLFIGTHLIQIQGLTDELYEKAVETQSDSQQQNVYYKSELADGLWYDITDASGLSDITSEGTPIDESELDDLYVCYYTGADGLTKDAKTGDVVSIFDDPDPYDLLKLEELDPIRRVYEGKYIVDEDEDELEGSAEYLQDKLNEFFSQNMHTETTDRYDRMLENLQKCYEAYSKAEMSDEAQVIMTLMDGIDAARRADVFDRLTDAESTTDFLDVNELINIASGTYYDDVADDYDDEAFVADSALTESVSSSLSQCTESLSNYENKKLSSGDTVLRSYIYDQSMKLSDLSETGSDLATNEDVLSIVHNIKYAMNIEDGVVGDEDAELALINDEFMPQLEDTFSQQLHQGVSQQYQAAAKENRSDAAKQSILESDQTSVESARSQLESMITAKKERLSSSEAVSYVYECITWTNNQKSGIKDDAFESYAEASADAHIEWLVELAKGIADGDESLASTLDQLKDQLEEYQQKQQEALDDNNLVLAAQYNTLAEDTSDKIAAEEARLNEIIQSDSATEAEKAEAKVALGDTGLLNDIEKLKQTAESAISAENKTGWDSALEMLGTLGGENALNQLSEELSDSNLSASDKEKWQKTLDEAITASKESSLHDQANATATGSGSDGTGSDGSGSGSDGSGSGSASGSGSGSGSGSDGSSSGGSGSGSGSGSGTSANNPSTLSEQMLLNAIEEVLGGSFNELDAKDKAAAVAGLDMLYDKYSNVNAKTLAGQYVSRCASANSPYIYKKLSGHSETEYISLAIIGNRIVSSYRYVYSDSRQEATLTYGAKSYSFRVGSSVVGLADGTQKEIDTYKVEFQNVPYIDEATAKEYFDCEAEYIAGTDYSACLTKSIKEKAEELYQTLTDES